MVDLISSIILIIGSPECSYFSIRPIEIISAEAIENPCAKNILEPCNETVSKESHEKACRKTCSSKNEKKKRISKLQGSEEVKKIKMPGCAGNCKN